MPVENNKARERALLCLFFIMGEPVDHRQKEDAMTRKELLKTKEQYKRWALVCIQSEKKDNLIAGTCKDLANEMCYTHHERGQRLWAFFQAMKELEENTYEDRRVQTRTE